MDTTETLKFTSIQNLLVIVHQYHNRSTEICQGNIEKLLRWVDYKFGLEIICQLGYPIINKTLLKDRLYKFLPCLCTSIYNKRKSFCYKIYTKDKFIYDAIETGQIDFVRDIFSLIHDFLNIKIEQCKTDIIKGYEYYVYDRYKKYLSQSIPALKRYSKMTLRDDRSMIKLLSDINLKLGK